MKDYVIVNSFSDIHTGEMYETNKTYPFSDERVEEIKAAEKLIKYQLIKLADETEDVEGTEPTTETDKTEDVEGTEPTTETDETEDVEGTEPTTETDEIEVVEETKKTKKK